MTIHAYEDTNYKMKICVAVKELKVIKVLGRGATGIVLLVVRAGYKEDNPFALKVISKHKKSRGIEREREILSSLHHPFLPFLMGEVETDTMVGWAVEYCPGGDLHHLSQIQPETSFSESAIRFYAAEVVLALEHLHSQGIVYRDLKPENILVQSSGHIMLTDFDLSRRLLPHLDESHPCHDHHQQQQQHHSCQQREGWSVLGRNLTSKAKTPCPSTQPSPPLSKTSTGILRSNSFVGTNEYVAPEIVSGEGHEFSVDWWSLGILLYEMLYGHTPFKGSNKKETFARILFMQPKLKGPFNPLHDLILKLLEKNPQNRLGFCTGADEVKSHVFFTGLHWDIIDQVCRPPIVPDLDTSYGDILSSDLEIFIQDRNSVSESEENETSDSEIDGLF